MSTREKNGTFGKGNEGKPKGAKSKKSLQWEKMGDFMTNESSLRAQEIMSAANNEDFMDYYFKMLEYFKPKQIRNTGEIAVDTVVRVVFDKKKF